MKDLLGDAALENQFHYLYTATAKELYNFALMVYTENSKAFECTVNSFVKAFVESSGRKKVNDVHLFKSCYLKYLYRYGKNSKASKNQDLLPPDIDDNDKLIKKLDVLSYNERFVLLLFCRQKSSMKCIAKIIQRPKFMVSRFLLSAAHKLNF